MGRSAGCGPGWGESELARLLPFQIDDAGDIKAFTVAGLESPLGLHDVGNFLHAFNFLRREAGAESLALDCVTDHLLARDLLAVLCLKCRLGNEVRSDQ